MTTNPRRRPPTGAISWPIILLAGGPKAGKSFRAIEASGSKWIGQTFYIAVGETDVDELIHVPGARFEEFTHDGTLKDIATAFREASAEPQVDGKPTLLIFDSSTPFWDLVQAEQRAVSIKRKIKRAEEQAKKYGGDIGDARQRVLDTAEEGGAKIEFDQWPIIHERFGRILKIANMHNGPVIITARLDETTVVDSAGKPTKDKQWSIKTSGKAPYDVQGIIEMPKFGEPAYLRGIRSPVMAARGVKPTDINQLPDDWNFDWLWAQYGIGDPQYTIQPRRVVTLNADPYAEKASNLPAAAQEIADAAFIATDAAQITRLRADAEDLQLLGMRINVANRDGVLHELLDARARMLAQPQPAAQEPTPAPTAAELSAAHINDQAERAQEALARVGHAQPDTVHAHQPEAVHAHNVPDVHAQPAPEVPDVEPPNDWEREEAEHAAPPEPEDRPTAAAPPVEIPAGVGAAPAGETKAQRATRHFHEEFAYQATVLGIEPAIYATTPSASPDPDTPGVVLSEDGNLEEVKAHRLARFLVAQRPVVVTALQDQGRVSEAEAYEATGLKTPVDLAMVFARVAAPTG